MRSLSFPLVLLLSTACGSSEPPSGGGVSWDDDTLHAGEGTFYDADGTGNCSFEASGDFVAALNEVDWSGSAYCGGCADVTGPDGSVRVRIVDRCPECAAGDLDLSEAAFAELAAPERGRVPIEWKWVSCDVAGPLEYQFKDGSSQWWVQLQVRNHRYPIASVEWSPDGEDFTALERRNHNYFEAADGFGDRPVQIRVTAATGAVVIDELPPARDSLLVEGTQQFD